MVASGPNRFGTQRKPEKSLQAMGAHNTDWGQRQVGLSFPGNQDGGCYHFSRTQSPFEEGGGREDFVCEK